MEIDWQSRQVKMVLTIIVGIISVYFWISNTRNYQEKSGELCKNGQITFGHITRVALNNNNEGNIHTWDVSYFYLDDRGTKFYGKTNESGKLVIKFNDSINVIFSKTNPAIHRASMNKVENQCIDLSSAMFKLDNLIPLILGLMVVILIYSKNVPD